jgi:uncharacterized metal-binding protein YceD (DUF177 family)
MKALKQFTINYASLAEGEHHFNYHVDNKFLIHFEAALVQEANIAVQLLMVKFINSIELNFQINGSVLIPCDVCNEEFNLTINGLDKISVKIVHEIPKQGDEFNIIYLEESMSSINIAEMLYELIMLSIPMRRVHPEDEAGNPTCDKTILKYLSEGTTESLDHQETTKTNPIWDELKKLK